jgi:nitroimidazol reductase NimA-like FMN-containing flavoprotein (pyridoxamine 5'-phosphate oxidase superfamily)
MKRFHERAVYDRQVIEDILDEGLVCHLGFADPEGQPFVVPTAYIRDGERLLIHGSAASRTLRDLSRGIAVCLTVTHADGLILARTAFNHSFNYRSVMVFGVARAITDPDEKVAALERLTNGLVPGRWDDIRQPVGNEVKATSILVLDLDEASAKVRTGPPGDEGEDLEFDTWAGVIPFSVIVGAPETDPKLAADYPVPRYVSGYRLNRGGSDVFEETDGR